MSTTSGDHASHSHSFDADRVAEWDEREASADSAGAARDIADVPAVEVLSTACIHLMSAAAVKLGLGDEEGAESFTDLDEARKLINALAGLVTAAAPEISDSHARPIRDGLRTLQLRFREISLIPDPHGQGPGEKFTGPVS
ncbi:DUF1844 domain-containing protein [Microbacterium amylolyticum]|uniref:DUF1844 domain-containing protein n=1 Tax=Microbacterium amylolyticum TaxID=936337 RepID=A0ABS4ZFX8_9MICO|nr:DUF1844 domain-containing protein [Microbacterium amylolyticum]MBP2436127.1 hypothetical protein [Microbacterium amylolyticum]